MVDYQVIANELNNYKPIIEQPVSAGSKPSMEFIDILNLTNKTESNNKIEYKTNKSYSKVVGYVKQN